MGVQGVRTPALLIGVPFFEKNLFFQNLLFREDEAKLRTQTFVYVHTDLLTDTCLISEIDLKPISQKHQAERSFSFFRRIKTCLRNNMGETQLSALSLMGIHYARTVDINEVVDEFIRVHPRRLFDHSLLT